MKFFLFQDDVQVLCKSIKHRLKIMKLSFPILILLTADLFAAENFSQAAGITIAMKASPFREVLSSIEKQTDFLFVYDRSEIDLDKKITIAVRNKSVSDVLNSILHNTDVTYAVEGNNIMLMKKPRPESLAAQQDGKNIRGTVTDANGEPIIGANVVEKGTTNGTITNPDGEFSLAVRRNAVLTISYIGYAQREINIGNQQILAVKLTEDTQRLDEIVVVGYGTQKRSDVTTAVSSVSSGNLKDRSAVNFGEALAGQAAGLMIQQINGAPGGEGLVIRVRGTGSVTSSNEPLYVVDGYPMEDAALNLITPSDIESIQILKDASSTAIYGSRGANGVIIITTKKGQSGKPAVRLNVYAGFQQREKKIEMMNRDEYVAWFIDGRNQAWLDAGLIAEDPDRSPHSIHDSNARRSLYPSAGTQYLIPDGTGGYKYNFFDPASVARMEDNDWQDLLFRNAPVQEYDLSVSGGSENTRYTFSGAYTNQEGIVLNTNYERFNFRTNVSSRIARSLEVGMSLIAYISDGREQANGKDAPILYALNLPPIYPLKNDDGTYGSMVRNPEILTGDVANPISIAENVYDKRQRYGWMGTVFAEWEIIKNLKYRIGINGGIRDNNPCRKTRLVRFAGLHDSGALLRPYTRRIQGIP